MEYYKKEKNTMLGYYENGSIRENEAAVVKFVFTKFNEYTKNPPADMVEAKIEAAKEKGETITYEEATKRVSVYEIECRIWEEIKANPEYAKAVKEYNERIGYSGDPNTIIGKLRSTPDVQSKRIISQEEWDKVQKAMKDKAAQKESEGEDDGIS